jgi:DNA polymerase bacteriophage-type
MKRELLIDTETFSPTPLKHGTHKYSEAAEVMIVSYAIDDPMLGEEGPITVVDLANGDPLPDDLTQALDDPEVIIVGHNFSMFDRTVIRHALGREIPVERIEDTMVQAQSHGLPGGLDKLCSIFKVPEDQAKHQGGRSLIQLFCVPRPKNMAQRRATKATHPVEWDRFLRYAGGDISSMRYLRKVMPRWNYPGKPKGNQQFSDEYRLWLLDQTINDRGFAVDLDLAESAVNMVMRHKKHMASRCVELTEGEVKAATQRDALLTHLLMEYGVTLPDMQKSTLERRLQDEELPWPVRELIALRLEASGTSQSKYQTLLNGVSADGRLRGTLAFCGAARTGRWAGRLFQPQNLPRPDMKADEIEEHIVLIKSDAGDLLLDEPMRSASNAIRGCIVAQPGHKLVVADLANIEGRVAAWLAGEDWKLKAFREYDAGIGPDLYKVAYGKAFNVDPNFDHKTIEGYLKRQIGKVMELMLQYEGGVGAFITGAMTYNIDLDAMADACLPVIAEDVLQEAWGFLAWTKKQRRSTFGLEDRVFVACDALKRLWRRGHPAIVAFWKALDEAIRQAILNPGVVTVAGRNRFHVKDAWLRMQLPSGRFLCYANPAIDEKGQISYQGLNSYTRQWQKIKTYAGKVFENDCQSVARDVMAHNMEHIEEAGFPIVLSVHDEIVTEPVDSAEYTSKRLEQLLAAQPFWADDTLPLAAAGAEMYRYAKTD